MKSVFKTYGYGCRYPYQKKGLSLGVILFLLSNGVQANELYIGSLKPSSGNVACIEEIEPVNLQREMSGRVIDHQGQPVSGVTVRIKGSNRTTTTDKDGRFSIAVGADAVLNISAIGYKAQEISAPSSGELQVRLERTMNDLEEVVVIGYGTQKKSDVTGAISSIKATDLPKAASTSVEQMLAGKAAGMQVQSVDAQPGGGVKILIRGAASTGAGNDPLYIIDGFPVSGGVDPGTNTRYKIGDRSPLNSINPNDIESIEVLKDASATAIYGARAANGVILITTKSGKMGKTRVSYDLKVTRQNMQKPWDMMNATEYMTAREDYLQERWMVDNKIGIYGNVDPSTVKPFTSPYTQQQKNDAGEGTNWIDEVTQNGKIQDHNITIDGASENTNYLISANYFNQDGIVKKNNFNRISGRVNLTQKVNKWLKVSVKVTGSKIDINNPALGTGNAEATGVLESALTFTPTLPVYNADGSYSIVPNSTFFPNPVSLLEISNNTEQNRLMGQTIAEIQPIKDLIIRTQLGFDKQDGNINSYLPKTTMYGASVGGQADINQNNKLDQLFNTTISYNKVINEIHSLNVLLGYEWQSMKNYGYGLSNNKFPTDAFLTNNIGAGASERPGVNSYKEINELASYFGRINYGLRDKYLLTVTMRADGSSRFGKGNKFGYFPSAALAWKIDQEDFTSSLDWLSRAKLRLSLGQTGNSNISGAFAFYSFGRDYLFGNTYNPGAYLSSYDNPNLKWETTTEFNFGLDLGLFNERVGLTVELFSKTVSDLLGEQQLKTYLPLDKRAANLGKTSSKGFETTLTLNNNIGNVKWNSSLMLSAYKDRWKERSPDVILKAYESATDPIRVHWGYVTDGLVKPGEIIPHMPNALPGVQKIKDINGFDSNNKLTGKPDGMINDADVVKIANQDPSLIVGFSNTFQYKNFDLNIHMAGMFGTRQFNQYMWYYTLLHADINRGWNVPNMANLFYSSKNQDAEYPNVNVTNSVPGANQFLTQKSDFIRVRNITLGYNITPHLSSQKWLSNFRVFVDATNPFVFTKYKGIDPEFTGIYPPAKSYTLGVSIGF